jgi:hypothetical protein
MTNRICYELITALQENEVAVCGSNLAGRHGAGFALYCKENFSAEYGIGFGPTGQCYMIPTKDRNINALPISQIQTYVSIFIQYAKSNSATIFKVSSVGCGLAGYTPTEIAPLFRGAVKLNNVHLPIEFWDILNQKK